MCNGLYWVCTHSGNMDDENMNVFVIFCTATRASRSATGAVINGTGPDGCLPELDMFPLLQVMCLWYMCFCAEVFFFLFSDCTPNGA